jgi:hypothetical protein
VSVPQFKELALMRIEEQIQLFTVYLVEQQQADYAQLRAYQGRIAGLQQARGILMETYRENYG